MKTAILTVCTLICTSLTVPARPQATVKPMKDGKSAAIKWLELLDAGHSGACWDQAAKTLRNGVSRSEWIAGMSRARRFYGRVLSRKFRNSAYASNPPGYTPGEYEILHFKVRLAIQGQATEAVSMVMGSKGAWLVAGYAITLKDGVRVHPLKCPDDRSGKFLGSVLAAQVRGADLFFSSDSPERLHYAPAGFRLAQVVHHHRGGPDGGNRV